MSNTISECIHALQDHRSQNSRDASGRDSNTMYETTHNISVCGYSLLQDHLLMKLQLCLYTKIVLLIFLTAQTYESSSNSY